MRKLFLLLILLGCNDGPDKAYIQHYRYQFALECKPLYHKAKTHTDSLIVDTYVPHRNYIGSCFQAKRWLERNNE